MTKEFKHFHFIMREGMVAAFCPRFVGFWWCYQPHPCRGGKRGESYFSSNIGVYASRAIAKRETYAGVNLRKTRWRFWERSSPRPARCRHRIPEYEDTSKTLTGEGKT